jgi:hypothetical protein
VPSIDIRLFRNARQLRLWLKAGEIVELYEDERLVARIFPPDASAAAMTNPRPVDEPAD